MNPRVGRQAANGRDATASVQHEIVSEIAASLGRAGDRLVDAVEDHRLLLDVGEATADQVERALSDVTSRAWALIVQRECAGFRQPGLAWLRQAYDLPDEALRRI